MGVFCPFSQALQQKFGLAGIVFILQAFFILVVKYKSFNLYPFVQFMGYRSIIDSLKKLLIFNGLCDIINSPKIRNLTATFKMINKLGGDLYD